MVTQAHSAALESWASRNALKVTPEDDLAETVLAVARGEIGKSEVTVFLRRWSTAL